MLKLTTVFSGVVALLDMKIFFTGIAQIVDTRLCESLTSHDTDARTLAQTLRPVGRDIPTSLSDKNEQYTHRLH